VSGIWRETDPDVLVLCDLFEMGLLTAPEQESESAIFLMEDMRGWMHPREWEELDAKQLHLKECQRRKCRKVAEAARRSF